MPLSYIYYYTFQYSSLIPLLYGLKHYKKVNVPLKYFLGYLTVSSILTIIMTVLSLQGQNNLWLMNISQPLYAGFLLWTFALWEKSAVIRRMMRLSIIFFVMVWAWEMTLGGTIFEFTTYSRPLLNILLIVSSCLILYEGNKNVDIPLMEQPQFWISAGVLLYFAGMIAVNLASSALMKISNEDLFAALMIQPALSFFAHLLYFVGFRYQCR